MTVTPPGRPKFSPGVRLRFDEVRGRHVLLYPEGALALNDTAAATLDLVDGRRTTSEIVAALRARYVSEEMAADVQELLCTIHEQGLVEDVDA